VFHGFIVSSLIGHRSCKSVMLARGESISKKKDLGVCLCGERGGCSAAQKRGVVCFPSSQYPLLKSK